MASQSVSETIDQHLNEAREMDSKLKHDPRIVRGERAFMTDTTEIMVKSVVVVPIPNEVIRFECDAQAKNELNYRELYDIAARLKLTQSQPLDNPEFDNAGTRTIHA